MSESKVNEEQRYVAVGNPLRGLTFYGPFDDNRTAHLWGSAHHADETWWIGTLVLTGVPEAARTLDPVSQTAHLVLIGGPADGYLAHGPFVDGSEAASWAEEGYPEATWWIAPLHAPRSEASGFAEDEESSKED